MTRVSLPRTVVIAGLTLFGMACHDPTPTAPSDPITISGRVIDFATGVGISTIGLTFGDRRLTTDAGGSYSITVSFGDYALLVNGEVAPETVLVRGSDCGSRCGNITERGSGKPIVGAQISTGAMTTSDVDGWYRVDGGCGSCGSCNTAIIEVVCGRLREIHGCTRPRLQDVRRLDIELDRL